MPAVPPRCQGRYPAVGMRGWHGLRVCTAGPGAGHEHWDAPTSSYGHRQCWQQKAKDQQKSQGLWKEGGHFWVQCWW